MFRIKALGKQMKFGILSPSTNTVVQPDMDLMRPRGVVHCHAHITVPDQVVASDDDFLRLLATAQAHTLHAVDAMRGTGVQQLVMGLSVSTFWDGLPGALAYQSLLQDRAGVPVSCGSLALRAALERFGVRRIAFFSPYFEVANAQVTRFLQDCGFSVVRDIALRRPSPVQIATTPEAVCLDAMRRLDGDDVDAIVQVGTNLPLLRLAAAEEQRLGKPVLAINAVTYWHALRSGGNLHRIEGFGRLFSQH